MPEDTRRIELCRASDKSSVKFFNSTVDAAKYLKCHTEFLLKAIDGGHTIRKKYLVRYEGDDFPTIMNAINPNLDTIRLDGQYFYFVPVYSLSTGECCNRCAVRKYEKCERFKCRKKEREDGRDGYYRYYRDAINNSY